VGRPAGLKTGAPEGPKTLIAVLAVVTEYSEGWLRNELRKSWYLTGKAADLESSLGVKVLFVIGSNPMTASDGTGEMPDGQEVASEAADNSDILRVPSVHTAGNEGKAQLVHDLWRSLAALYEAHFYVKAQVCERSP
jgi:hypothetical protein